MHLRTSTISGSAYFLGRPFRFFKKLLRLFRNPRKSPIAYLVEPEKGEKVNRIRYMVKKVLTLVHQKEKEIR